MFATNLPFCNRIAICSFVCLIVLMFAINGCNSETAGKVYGRHAVCSFMDRAESAMDDNPEYADSLMQLIDYNSIRNREQRARFALLFTATQYKTYQPFTSDTLIMVAVKYYSINNNIDYRFLSYYYLGCVYMEMGQKIDAAVAFAQAEQFVDWIDNDYWKGLLYTNLGKIFSEVYNQDRAEEYYVKANYHYNKTDKELHKIYALYYLGKNKYIMHDYMVGDSLIRIAERKSLAIGDKGLYKDCVYGRLYSAIHMQEPDSAMQIINEGNIIFEKDLNTFGYNILMALYYNTIGEICKSDYYLNQARIMDPCLIDSIHLYYTSSIIARSKGQLDEALDYFLKYTSLQLDDLKSYLNQPISIAQRDYFRTATELEATRAHNRVILLITSIIISLLVISIVILVNLHKRKKTQLEIRDYLETIDDLTTQVSINQGKIITLNTQVREMLRQQFTPSDYLYTRYYEQIDDNKKAERLYRVVKNQIDSFTSSKNINHIDELLNNSYNGIMEKLLSSGLDIKEKDLLILRFVLAGFSAKSIATLLGETHQNITQRKKRMLDKIGLSAPKLMEELHIALSSR